MASLSLNVNDIFRTKKFDSYAASFAPSGFLQFEQNTQRRRDPQVFRLNFNYRFGKFDANLFKRKNNRTEGEGGNGWWRWYVILKSIIKKSCCIAGLLFLNSYF